MTTFAGDQRPTQPHALARTVNGGPVIEGRYIATPSLDPGNIVHMDGYEDHKGYVQPAVEAFSEIHSALKCLSDARVQVARDPSKTEAQQVLIVAKEAETLMERSTRAFDCARKRLSDGINAIDKQLSDPLGAKADNSLSAEIRAHCFKLAREKRMSFVNEAIESKDMTTLQAVLGGPPYLSGLTIEMQKHFTRQYRELTSPDLVGRLDVMRKSLHLIEQRSGLVITEIERALGANWGTVKKLRETQNVATQALLLINNPVQRS